jgi:hypothetical protein
MNKSKGGFIMDFLELVKANMIYGDMAKEENYTNEKTMNIWTATVHALYWYKLAGTEADEYACGDFTRRFEDKMRELERLMEG